MAKKCNVPAHIKYGFGAGPNHTHVPPGECRQLFAFNVPADVCIVVKRFDKVCGVKVSGTVCGPCGPLKMDADCPQVNLVSEGRYDICIINPNNSDLSKMVVACYETKETEAQPGGGMAGLSGADVKIIVEGCLAPALCEIEKLKAKTDELMATQMEQGEAIEANKACIDDLTSVNGA